VGRYVLRSDRERTYRELCAAESWEPFHWTAIARQLRQMTKKREVKRAGVRFVAYQIPLIRCENKRRGGCEWAQHSTGSETALADCIAGVTRDRLSAISQWRRSS
jgi:hypothetical protein